MALVELQQLEAAMAHLDKQMAHLQLLTQVVVAVAQALQVVELPLVVAAAQAL